MHNSTHSEQLESSHRHSLLFSSQERARITQREQLLEIDKTVERIIKHINEDEFIEAMKDDSTSQRFLHLRMGEIVVEVIQAEFSLVMNELEGQLDQADHLLRVEKDHQDALQRVHQDQLAQFQEEIAQLQTQLVDVTNGFQRADNQVKEVSTLNTQLREAHRQEIFQLETARMDLQKHLQSVQEKSQACKDKRKVKVQAIQQECDSWQEKYQKLALESREEQTRLQRTIDNTVDEASRGTIKLNQQIETLKYELKLMQGERNSLEEAVNGIKNEISSNYISIAQHKEILAQVNVTNTSESLLKAAEIINQAVETKDLRDQQYIQAALRELDQAKEDLAQGEMKSRNEIKILRDQASSYRVEFDNLKAKLTMFENMKREIEIKYEEQSKEVQRLRISIAECTANERVLSERVWNVTQQAAEQKSQYEHHCVDLKKQIEMQSKQLSLATEQSNQEIENITKQKKSLKQSVTVLQKQVEEAQNRLEEQYIKNEGFQRLFSEQDGAIEDLHRQAESLASQLQEREADFNESIQSSEVKLSAVLERNSQLQGIIDQQQSQLSASEQTLSEMDQLLKQIESRLKEQEACSSKAQAKMLQNHQIIVAELNEQLQKEDLTIENLQTEIQQKDEEFENLQQKFKVYHTELETIKKKIANSMVDIIRRINEDLQSFKAETIQSLQSYESAFEQLKVDLETALSQTHDQIEKKRSESLANQKLIDADRRAEQQQRNINGLKGQLSLMGQEIMELKAILVEKSEAFLILDKRFSETSKELSSVRISSGQVADIYEERIASLKRKMNEAEKEFSRELHKMTLTIQQEQQKLSVSEISRNQLKQYVVQHIDSNFDMLQRNLGSQEAAAKAVFIQSARSSYNRYPDSTFDQSPIKPIHNNTYQQSSPFSPIRMGSAYLNENEGTTNGKRYNNLSSESMNLIRSHSAMEVAIAQKRDSIRQHHRVPSGVGTPDKQHRSTISNNNRNISSRKPSNSHQNSIFGGNPEQHNRSQYDQSTSPQRRYNDSSQQHLKQQTQNFDQQRGQLSASASRQSIRTPTKPSIHYMIPNIPHSQSQSQLLKNQKKDIILINNANELKGDNSANLSFRAPFSHRS